jgi:hypothetical protein
MTVYGLCTALEAPPLSLSVAWFSCTSTDLAALELTNS